MHNILSKETQSGIKIRLTEDSPLSSLNSDFPTGLPAQEFLLGGRSFYGIPSGVACNHLRRIGEAMVGAGLPETFSYCVSIQKVAPVPVEWAIELNSP